LVAVDECILWTTLRDLQAMPRNAEQHQRRGNRRELKYDVKKYAQYQHRGNAGGVNGTEIAAILQQKI
jgi:hypothetical protein